MKEVSTAHHTEGDLIKRSYQTRKYT
jgi:hypothetical protein